MNPVGMTITNPFPKRVCSTSLLKTLCEKEKLLVPSNFFFSQCFLPFWRTFCHLHRIQYCHLETLRVWKGLKFVVGERVNPWEEYRPSHGSNQRPTVLKSCTLAAELYRLSNIDCEQ